MSKEIHLAIVDDDDVYSFTTQLILKRMNKQVQFSAFQNGLEAIHFLKQHNNLNDIPDLILLDINMPVMDGWQFLEELVALEHKLSKVPSVYMITSSVWPYDKQKAQFYSMVKGFLSKPIYETDLAEIFAKSNLL